MTSPIEVFNLAIADNPARDRAEATRRLDHAGELVREFVAHSGLPALDLLLAAASHNSPLAAAEGARAVADELAQQTGLLFGEVDRFLTVTKEK